MKLPVLALGYLRVFFYFKSLQGKRDFLTPLPDSIREGRVDSMQRTSQDPAAALLVLTTFAASEDP